MEDKSIVNSIGGDVKGIFIGSDNTGDISTIINELPSSEPNQPCLKELLAQLQKAIEADPNLTKEDKEDALEQVKNIAEAGKNPNDAQMKDKAKKADRMLGRIISVVPKATELLQLCSNLLPLITKVFGI